MRWIKKRKNGSAEKQGTENRYFLSQSCIRPFNAADLKNITGEHLTLRHKGNKKLSKIQVKVEHAFGLLKAAFLASAKLKLLISRPFRKELRRSW
ncbi:hypothetical protein FRC00_001504 [Tulasnella sp. 408]|nr:hypothetical protein FRC00_001504 [Tulasnella sp. 408]